MKFIFSSYYFWNPEIFSNLKYKKILLLINNSFKSRNFLSYSFYFKTLTWKRISNTKTRSEIKGSGKKLRPQKGTGQARLGSVKSPSLRGGGVNFGPKPTLKIKKINRKEKQLLSSILFFNKKNKIMILNDFFFLDLIKIKKILKNFQKFNKKTSIIFYSSKNSFLVKYHLYLQNFQRIKFQNVKYFSNQSLFQTSNLYFLNSAFNEFTLKLLKSYDNS